MADLLNQYSWLVSWRGALKTSALLLKDFDNGTYFVLANRTTVTVG
jgi:hypothetical protein